MEFDPYREMLGIPPGPRPPTPEQLLGLRPGEGDEQAIFTAAARQKERLNSYVLGKWAEEAIRLQREVGGAIVELTKRAGAAAKSLAPSPRTSPPPSAADEVAELIAPPLGFMEDGASMPQAAPGLPAAGAARRPKPPEALPESSRHPLSSDLPSGQEPLLSGSGLADLEKAAALLGDLAPEQHAAPRLLPTPWGLAADRASVRRQRRRRLLLLGLPFVGIFLVVFILSLTNLRSPREVSQQLSPSGGEGEGEPRAKTSLDEIGNNNETAAAERRRRSESTVDPSSTKALLDRLGVVPDDLYIIIPGVLVACFLCWLFER